ncbi:MAG: hypothetical protein ETSY2_31540 [Candidatus Entotheonella gemina]|uniref:Alanine dehydrogenase/pyridine nucleotide transhydrogenase N-terminal domain-containing protein n=1 Tax=Candidatus Entotheonella gemina TaxID=1429439 RepID=W4M1F4_9BACT|nr:MAG: hypothetical protein ETSY2_31540 [Candidatus Entotheonella gemina]
MKIGVVKEIKNSENRVALTPAGAEDLHQAGHEVWIQAGAGLGSGFSDEAYLAAGAKAVALTTATLPYAMRLAQQGIEALRQDSGFAKGVNTHQGALTCKPVAEYLGLIPRFKPFSAL